MRRDQERQNKRGERDECHDGLFSDAWRLGRSSEASAVSLSECEASVSPSQRDWPSGVGLSESDDTDEDEPVVQSSLSKALAWWKMVSSSLRPCLCVTGVSPYST